jgi:phosphotriesterase-related protein
MKKAGLLQKVIISHDAGYYDVVDPTIPFLDYNTMFDHFIPLLRQNNFTESDIHQLLTANPASVFTI